MSLKKEFVHLALNKKINFSALCKQYGISRETGYKWLSRFQEQGNLGLEERSRKPRHSPRATSKDIIDCIVAIRIKHPCWGAKKLKRILENKNQYEPVSHVTINRILRHNNLINEKISSETKKIVRFEHEKPNDLWQMDFKGDFPIQNEGRCYPLTIIDDHSRFSLCIQSCSNQKQETVQPALIKTFEQYGLPSKILIDNGTPWATVETENKFTRLSLWLVELGIKIIFCRPARPQTKGKDERFHRTLKDEVTMRYSIRSHREAQRLFDMWRPIYNCDRPHEALGYDTPSQHYCASNRVFTGIIKTPEYMLDDIVRRVDSRGTIFFKNKRLFVGGAFRTKHVAIRPIENDGIFNVFFYNQIIKRINFKDL